MSRRTYTAEEQAQLRVNRNVLSCTDKTITYSEEFKRFVLRGYFEEGRSPRDLFAEKGFPASIVNTLVPKWTLQRWRRKYGSTYAEADLSTGRGRSKGGGRPRKSKNVSAMSSEERAAYFEARSAYLDKENDFLAETRGLRRWPRFVWNPGKNSR